MARPFAVFDIDGTIIRWQLYHAIGDGMAKRGLISQEDFGRVRRARMNWKRRAGEDSFDEYEMVLVETFDKALAGLDVGEFKQVVGAVFDEYKEQVYRYTRDLINELKKKDYLLFAVSGSPEMIVELIAEFYGFDDFAGTAYGVADGKFSGEKTLSLGRKAELVKQLAARNNATFDGSVGVGDTEGDISMLALTEQPVAFNPNTKLYEHAKAAGWPIVVERKNVVYRLEEQDGSYRLA